jgi:uncharacterized membrane protein HdeD (DUF308 family)
VLLGLIAAWIAEKRRSAGYCAFSILFGILLVAIPVIGLLTLVWLVGAYALVFGLLLLGLAFRLRKHPVRVSHAEMTR